MRRYFWRQFIGFWCLMVMAAFSFLTTANAQQTLGSINGTVLDPSGAAVSGSTITITDAEINFTRTVKAQSNGFFQIFNLPVGTYKVQAAHDGFDTTNITGIDVKEAGATTLNVTLKVGQATTSVDVSANTLLNASDATNGYTLDKEQIELTPLATGSFTQLAVLSPGVNAELLSGIGTNAGLGNQPIWANGQRDTSNTFQVNGVDVTNLFNGKSSSGDTSQRYNFNIGGGSTGSGSSAGAQTIGGANSTGTSAYGSNGNSLPSPPQEFLQELRVNTSMYDAQQGATSGAQIDVNTLTGTNHYHGQLYGTFANNALNADPFFFKQQVLLGQEGIGAFPSFLANPSLHRWTTGATVGGPLKKNKLFFFIGYQHLYDSDQSTGLSQFQVPTGLTSDRSDAGIDKAVTSWNNGTAYTGAISSIARQLLNATLPNGQYLIPSAQTSAAYAYGIPNVTLVDTSRLQGDMANAALDYQVSATDRLSAKYYYQNAPVQAPFNFSQTGGFPAKQANIAQVGALDNTITLGPKINWEQRLGYSRMGSYSYYTQTLGPDPLTGSGSYGIGLGNANIVQGLLPGLLISEMPINSSAAPGLKVGPYSYFDNLGYYQNRLNPSTNAIFAVGKHTVAAGGGYNFTQLNIENHRNDLPIVREKTFETFVQGAAPTSVGMLKSIPVGSNHDNANRYYRSNEADAYVQDKWQILSNLSITAGVRWDYHGGLTEKYGNMFNFDPTAYDVSGTTASGFTVNNSGFVVAGNSPNATPGATDSTLTGRQWGVSPRVAFAWAPKRDNGKFVIRGGAGIYYDRGELFSYLSQPAGNGSGGPFGVTESAPLSNFITAAGSSLGSPIGAAPAPTGLASAVNGSLQTTLNSMTGPGTTNPSLQRCSGLDNQVNYADCGYALNFGAYNKNNVLPYTINYSFNMQWQPRNDLAVTFGYTGNRGRHAVIPIPFNEPQIATPSNPGMVLGKNPHASGETQSYGFDVIDLSRPSGILSRFGDPTYNTIPGEYWNTEDGGNSDLRAPYIGFSPNAALFTTSGNSAYDALETHLEKRLSHFFQVGASYTWSHTLDEQSDIGLFFTGDDPAHLRDSYASSDFDRTNVFTANYMVQLPNFVRKGSPLSYLTNGWNTTGIAVLQSGEPYSLYEFYGAVGSVRFGDFPTLMNPVLPIKGTVAGALTGNKGALRAAGGNYLPALDPSAIAINYLAPGQKGVPVETNGGPQDTYETDFVAGQRNIFRQSPQKRLDISFRKDFKMTDRYGLQYQFNVFNLTNTTSLDIPQNQTQIRQDDACQNGTLNAGCENVVNYGQVGTTAADQGSTVGRGTAGANLDRLPVSSGTGKATTIPLFLSSGGVNNGATFGSVTNTIGSSRLITMGLRFTY